MKFIIFLFLFNALSCAQVQDSKLKNASSTLSGDKVEETLSPSIYNNYFTNLHDSIGFSDSGIEKRVPYLLYYAVDSVETEPFLSHAINYEFNQLKNICNGNAHVNWIFIRNSEVVTYKKFHACNHGSYEEYSIAGLLEYIQEKIDNLKRVKLSENIENCTVHSNSYLDDMDYLKSCYQDKTILNHAQYTRYFDLQNVMLKGGFINQNEFQEIKQEELLLEKYKDFPLAYPEFFELVINSTLIMHPFINQSLYVPFIHVKTHGHIDYGITGLLPHQIKSKKDYQTKQINQLSTYDLNLTKEITGQKEIVKASVSKFYELINEKIKREEIEVATNIEEENNQVNEDSAFNLSQDMCNGLGSESEDSLSASSSNAAFLGTETDGLGVGNIYLGNHIGITPAQIITKVYDTGFLFLEACDANLGSTEFQNIKFEKPVGFSAMYSAQGSLWYRNIDWDLIFNELGKEKTISYHSSLMQYLIIDVTKSVKNYVYTDSKKFVDKYNAIKKAFASELKKTMEQ